MAAPEAEDSAMAVVHIPASGASGLSLVVIDDDDNFLNQVREGLSDICGHIHLCPNVPDGLSKAGELIKAGKPALLIVDLIIARSDRNGILGGMEVLERIREQSAELPVIMVTDYENADAQVRAEDLGITNFLSKPRRAQMKQGQITRPMQELITTLKDAIAPLTMGLAPALDAPVAVTVTAPPEGTFDLGRELGDDLGEDLSAEDSFFVLADATEISPEMQALKSMLAELNDPANKETITLLVLRFASEMLPRAVLFLVTKREVIGLGGFSAHTNSADFVQRVRSVRIPTEEDSVFRTVIRFKAPYRGMMPETALNKKFINDLGQEDPSDIFAAPIISGNQVAAILYGDNIGQEEKLGSTQGLEIFLLQAGLAMERTLLERKLREATKS